MPSTTKVHQLPNGIRLATTSMPHMSSVAAGIWAGVGSRHELASEHGMAHLIEHLLFKGTPSRSSRDISRDIERLGATIDGFTVEDHTAYQAVAPAAHLEKLLDVLSDFYQRPTMDPSEIESEKMVIREEIAMIRDQPSQYLDDLLTEACWGDWHALGRSITGTEESLSSFSRDKILKFFRQSYVGANTVISLAGNIDHQHAADLVTAFWSDLPEGKPAHADPAATTQYSHRFAPCDEQEQDYLALAFPSVNRHDPQRYAHIILNVILGENMSSRLFQAIREEMGFCYEIQSDLACFEDVGMLQVYLALNPNNLRPALKRISHIIADLSTHLISESELADAKAYLIGQNQVALESTSAQMNWAGECLLYSREWIDPAITRERLNRVTAQEVREAAVRVFNYTNLSSALIGDADSEAVFQNWLAACP